MSTKSTKQIADELGLKKMQVYHFVNSRNLEPSDVKGKTKYYDEGVQNAVKQHFFNTKINTKVNSDDNNEGVENEQSFNTDLTLDYVNELKEQLKTKDAQISTLTTLLNQEQQLNLVAHKKLEKLENPGTTEPTEPTEEEVEPTPPQKGFWARLFNQ